jgi:methylated-DNA-[protein]-cysteine S-methyltransferase
MDAPPSLLVDSPIGPLGLVGTRDGLARIDFHAHAAPGDGTGTDADRALLESAREQLEEYFAGRRREFTIPLRPSGTAFQRQVWDELQRIPYGDTISYADLARRLGRPTATRAVGTANGANPLPIVVPCHRVIASDGTLCGFGGGLPVKRYLLDLEAGPGRSGRLPFD